MRVCLLHLDGKFPNLALMRIAAHHRSLGDSVELRRTAQPERTLYDGLDAPDLVYASAIFRTSIPTCERVAHVFPHAKIGGTAIDPAQPNEIVPFSPVLKAQFTDHGLGEGPLDYSDYPDFRQSMGFTQRGCRLNCSFCLVPQKEGKVREAGTIASIWRGDPWPRELLLLDNDFFGQPAWRDRIAEIRDGHFKVSFNQGINARCLTEEAAEAIASVDYRDDSMTTKRIYTAWDNQGDEEKLMAGLARLVKYGVKPDHIMVYMLIGYWPGETAGDREYRRRRLREFGARPYPMPYVRTKELVGFQRWVVRRADLKCSWEDFKAADYRPEKVGIVEEAQTGREDRK